MTDLSPYEEERLSNAGPAINPWEGPAPVSTWSGFLHDDDYGYAAPLARILEVPGHAVAAGEGMLAGLAHDSYGLVDHVLGGIPGVHKYVTQPIIDEADWWRNDAKERVQALTPSATQVGSAIQTGHSLLTALTEAGFGGAAAGPYLAAATVGGSQGYERRAQLEASGVAPAPAGFIGLETAATSAAGVLTPGLGGVGTSLMARLLTGAGANVGFGVANRYADHLTLEAAGYPDMAQQQKVWDGYSMLFDAVLGAGFGGLGHLHHQAGMRDLSARLAALRQIPGVEDAVMAAQLGLRAQGLGPGIPADPAAAAAHHAALEKATEDLINGQPVDVSGTGVDTANFVPFYHGSPHEFTSFEAGRIGTGEGGDSFGHGIYLAESRAVADSYAEALGARSIRLGEKVVAPNDFPIDSPQRQALSALMNHNGVIPEAIAGLRAQAKGVEDSAHFEAAAKWLEKNRKQISSTIGNVYQVRVPSEAVGRMLDWNAPLKDQPPAVQQYMHSLGQEKLGMLVNHGVPLKDYSVLDRKTGKDLYEGLALQHLRTAGEGADHAAFASGELQRSGIPGLRYLDAFSRSGEALKAPTRNAVLFEEKLAQVAAREGARPYQAPEQPISTAGLDPRETILVKSFQDAGLLEAQRNVEALEQALNVRLGRGAPERITAPLRPEGTPSSPSPTAPVGKRWYADRGAIPGEPAQYLDVQGDDLDTAKAVIVERPMEGTSNSTWEALLPGGQSLGVFDTEEEAGRAAEVAVDKTGTTSGSVASELAAARKAPPPGFKIHPDEIPRADPGKLTEAQRAIETRFAEQIARDPEAAEHQYAQIEETDGGRILNTDTARELSEDYLNDRSQSAAVHEPSSWLIKRLYARMLKEAPKPGFDPLVLFMAGGTGAGKTSMVRATAGELFSRAQIIYDTNMSGLDGAIGKINQALDAGKRADVVYIYRDPAEALAHGALTRAMKQEAQWGSGRTVPLEEHTNTHVGSNHVIRLVASHFEGHTDVGLRYVDNARGAGKQAEVPLEQIPRLEYNVTREQVAKTLEDEYAAGRISEAVYHGFGGTGPAGEPGRAGAAGGAGPADEAAPAEHEPQRGPGRADELGATRSVYTAAGRQIEVRPKLIEAADLTTSDKPGYPQDLQPRQRGERTALASQVQDMARNLKPEMLGQSAEADRGAPIVGADNVVESGNGRVMALRQVYESLPEQSTAYRKFLTDSGYDIAGMKEPVLVRERVTPMSPAERSAFTGEANVGTTATYSPVEQAQADAKLLDSGTLAKMAGADLTTYTNAAFLRDFVSGLAPSERSAVMNPDGTISQAGVRRVQSAILAKAYGGTPESNATLGRLLESTETGLKSTLNALVDAAPAYARLKQMIEEGTIGREYDIAPAIVQAVEDVARLQLTGQSLTEHFAQADLLSPKALATQAFYDKAGERLAGRDKAAAALIRYADQAMAQRLNQGQLFGDPPASPTELLQNAKKPETGDLFGLRTKSGELAPGSIVVSAARSAIEERPNMELPDETGQVYRAKAALLATAEADRSTSERAAPAIEAATDCFLRKGP